MISRFFILRSKKMNREIKENKMETMPMGHLILDMSLPMMFSLLIQSLYNIVDSIFVARISETALTATSLAYPVQMLMISVGVGSAVGLNVILSKALGAGKKEEVSNLAVTGVLVAVFWGLLFGVCGLVFSGVLASLFTGNAEIAAACREYLFICTTFSLGNMVCMTYQRLMQATGKTTLSMVILICGAVTNIILDPIMIFGLLGCPAMGIRGAAIATVIGQWVSMIVGIVLQKYCNREIQMKLTGFKLQWKYIRMIYKVGLPTIIMQAMQSMMVTCFNGILQSFSTTAVAFFGVYYKLQTFLFMPMNGLGQAAIPIIGFNYGAKNKGRVEECIKLLYPAAVGIALVGAVVFFAVPGGLLTMFSASEDMLVIGIGAIRIMAPTFILAAISMMAGYIASGLQDGNTNMVCAFLRQFVPLIPCAWLLGRCFGSNAVWFAFWISETVGVVYAIYRVKKDRCEKLDNLS